LGLAVLVTVEDKVPNAVEPGLLSQVIVVVTSAVTATFEVVAALTESDKIISSSPTVPNKTINKMEAKAPKNPKTVKGEIFSFIVNLNI